MKTPKASAASGPPCQYDPGAPFEMPRQDMSDQGISSGAKAEKGLIVGLDGSDEVPAGKLHITVEVERSRKWAIPSDVFLSPEPLGQESAQAEREKFLRAWRDWNEEDISDQHFARCADRFAEVLAAPSVKDMGDRASRFDGVDSHWIAALLTAYHDMGYLGPFADPEASDTEGFDKFLRAFDAAQPSLEILSALSKGDDYRADALAEWLRVFEETEGRGDSSGAAYDRKVQADYALAKFLRSSALSEANAPLDPLKLRAAICKAVWPIARKYSIPHVADDIADAIRDAVLPLLSEASNASGNLPGGPYDSSDPVMEALQFIAEDKHATDSQRFCARTAAAEILRLRSADIGERSLDGRELRSLTDRSARLIFDSPIRRPLHWESDVWEETHESIRAECRYLAAEIAERAVKPYRAALEYAAMGLGRIHNSLTSTAPKQAVGEMTAHFSEAAQSALAAQSKGRRPGTHNPTPPQGLEHGSGQ